MMNQKISVRIKTKTTDLGRELERMVLSVGGFRLITLGDRERPDLFIFELSEKFDEEFRMLQSLLTSGEVGEVLVTSERKEL